MKWKLTGVALAVLLSVLLFAHPQEPDVSVSTEPTWSTTVPIPETTVVEETVATEAPVPTEPELLLHSGIREDGTFDQGTLFIGDSLTYGLVDVYLKDNGLLGDARYMARSGAAVTVFFDGPSLGTKHCVYSPEFEGLRFFEAVAMAGEEVTAIYFMMGTNYSKYGSVETYIDIVEYLQSECPDATVYLQLVPMDHSPKVNSQRANKTIRAVYDHFVQQGNQRLLLIDTHTAIGDNLTSDGIHLTTAGQGNWYQALLEYARENNIRQ